MSNNDPIQDYGTSKISKLFEKNSLKGERENKYEYNGTENIFEKYSESLNFDYNETYSNNTSKTNSNFLSSIIWILVAVWAIIIGIGISWVIVMTSPNEQKATSSVYTDEKMENLEAEKKEIEEIENKYNQYNFSKFRSISFNNGVTFSTLYKYESTRKTVNYQKYTYSDKRFGKYGITTVEIVYNEEITEDDRNTYMKALEENDYVPVEINDVGEYIIVKDNLNRNLFMMVILGKNRVVYGVGKGRVSDFLN